MNPYSTLKAAWHLDRMAEMRAGKQARPVSLQLILSDFCNQSCRWCAYRAPEGLSSELFGVDREDGSRDINPKRMIPTEKAFEILRDAAVLGVRSVTFTGGGEPTVHPDHLELFEAALNLGFDCSLNTNGVILREGWERVLSRFTYVRVSVDAGTPEEYARLRVAPVTMYWKVLKNIGLLVESCPAVVVGTGYVVTPGNWRNLLDGVHRLKETGCAYVRLACMQSKEGRAPYGEHWDAAASTCQIAKSEYEDERFAVVNLFESAMGQRMEDPFCGFQELVLYVGGDLEVYRCCYTAYSELGKLGSLKDQRLRDWWEGEQKQHAIASFDARSCETCPLKEKNETIGYMKKMPEHVNFI